MKKPSTLFFIAMLWHGYSCVEAARLIGAEVPPFVMGEGSPYGPGIAVEIILVAAKELGEPAIIEIKPFARALKETAYGHDSLLVPPGRVPERENLYRWVASLIDEAFVLFTDRRHHLLPLKKTDLAGLTIGVMRGSVGEKIIKSVDGIHIEASKDEITNAKKLALGRIDAWAVSLNTGLYIQRMAGLDERQLVRGDILSHVKLYIVSSPDLPLKDVLRWRLTIEKMSQDGTMQEIKKRYKYVSP